jgi:hypothetical protein
LAPARRLEKAPPKLRAQEIRQSRARLSKRKRQSPTGE